MIRRTAIRFVQVLTLSALAFLPVQNAAAAWDFLYRDATGNCATRSQSPFAVSDRAYRVAPLPSSWVLVGDSCLAQVEYAGEKWLCRDGTIVPAAERPKVISKLDLLLVLRELDKIDAFFAWLDASGLKPFWDAAQLLTTDHPLYEQSLASVQEALGISDEERDSILDRITHQGRQDVAQ